MRVKALAIAAALGGIAAIAVAALVLAGSGDEPGRAALPPPAPPVPSGPKVPALRGTDPVTGREITLSAYRGKPVVLNVWASWCRPCNAEAPILSEFTRTHPHAVLVGIDMQDSLAGARAFYRRYEWRHPSIFDADGALAANLGLLGMPTTIFLTRDHHESSRVVGPVSRKALLAGWQGARSS
jgi:thiol-disulfide isomerase/thioredoxin